MRTCQEIALTHAYTVDETALLVIDPYNDFMSEAASSTTRRERRRRHLASMSTCPASSPPFGGVDTRVHRPTAWRPGDYDGWLHLNHSQEGVRKA